jgi:hypothetical protein
LLSLLMPTTNQSLVDDPGYHKGGWLLSEAPPYMLAPPSLLEEDRKPWNPPKTDAGLSPLAVCLKAPKSD